MSSKLVAIQLDSAHQRQAKARRKKAILKRRSGRLTATAQYVSALAKQQGVIYKATFCDRWANAVTRLAGDEITSDVTDDLLVALTRAGSLSAGDMVKLAMDHHRELKLFAKRTTVGHTSYVTKAEGLRRGGIS